MNPDCLALTFYAGNYSEALDKNYSVEIQDTYHRLDKELARLLDAIDASVGLENTLIFVVSTGYFIEYEVIPEGMVTSGGIFYPDRSQALLNMYLMATYGRQQWIKKYYNRQFFFDRKLLEDNKIDGQDVQRRSAEAFAVRTAQGQAVQRLPAGRDLRCEIAAVVAVFIVTAGDVDLEGRGDREQHFEVGGLDVTVTGGGVAG